MQYAAMTLPLERTAQHGDTLPASQGGISLLERQCAGF
jgi:hypothetical protein